VPSLTSELPLKTRDTVAIETLLARATSRMVAIACPILSIEAGADLR
jgi:hypothetical protein